MPPRQDLHNTNQRLARRRADIRQLARQGEDAMTEGTLKMLTMFFRWASRVAYLVRKRTERAQLSNTTLYCGVRAFVRSFVRSVGWSSWFGRFDRGGAARRDGGRWSPRRRHKDARRVTPAGRGLSCSRRPRALLASSRPRPQTAQAALTLAPRLVPSQIKKFNQLDSTVQKATHFRSKFLLRTSDDSGSARRMVCFLRAQ